MGDGNISLIEFFKLGGWAMWPLLVFSVATVAIILERIIFFITHNFKVTDLNNRLIQAISDNKFDDALSLCKTSKKNKLASPILSEAIKSHRFGESRMEKSLEAESSKVLNELERGLNFLVALGSLAPITGFLGTVSGMITAFRDIANAADINAQLVAGGIFEALITTAYGLSIAIMAIAAHNILTHIVDKFATDIELSGTEIISSILTVTEGKN